LKGTIDLFSEGGFSFEEDPPWSGNRLCPNSPLPCEGRGVGGVRSKKDIPESEGQGKRLILSLMYLDS